MVVAARRPERGSGARAARAAIEAAKRFYEKYGFVAHPVDPMIAMITVAPAVSRQGGGR